MPSHLRKEHEDSNAFTIGNALHWAVGSSTKPIFKYLCSQPSILKTINEPAMQHGDRKANNMKVLVNNKNCDIELL